MSVALLESLQRANPVPVDAVANRRDLPSAHALFAEITAQRPQRVRRRTIVVVIALIVLAIAALVGAFAIVQRDEASLPLNATCFADRSLVSKRIVVPSRGDDAAACALLWENGTFARGPAP